MPHLILIFQSVPKEVTLDVLIAKFIDQIPGSKIIAEDWYTGRCIDQERVIDKLRQEGNPMQFGDAVMASFDHSAKSAGPTKGIFISLNGETSLRGRISRKLMLLHSDVPIDVTLANRVLGVFQPLGIVKEFRVSDLPSRRGGRKHG
ncbi:MAG: hypothetical protein ABSG31_13605 [Tepidisphaeraceae bacterium]